MNAHFISQIKHFTGASSFRKIENIQTLWGGYGQIQRFYLENGCAPSVVVKHVQFPPTKDKNNLSHNRKVRSYQVEIAWYKDWNKFCSDACRTPACLGVEVQGNEILIVLEDLHSAGYGQRPHSLSIDQVKLCLKWLAAFHAQFMGAKPSGLWKTGTYWHLNTRPDELRILSDRALKAAAPRIDQLLNQCTYQTFVHGDAKLANFCFSPSGKAVAAVDFQYVGKGCGMKDVAYLMDSCLYPTECAQWETALLDYYFACLKEELAKTQPEIDAQALENSWRAMYELAWADFYRFLKGWSPGHYDRHSYSDKIIQRVLRNLDNY